MAEVAYPGLEDTQKQQIKNEVATIKEYACPTLDSYKSTTRKVTGGQQGFQVPFFVSDYGQNSYLSPGASGNSFQQPIAPTSQSMWVGLAYPGKAMYTDGIFMETMDTKASLISNAKLRTLAIKNYMKHMNYYAIGDNFGYGILAVVTSVTGGVFTGTTAASTVSGYTKGAHRLLKNVTYDIVDESSLAVVGTITPTMDGIFSATVPVNSTGSPNNSGAFVVEQGAFFKVPRGTNYLINNVDRVFQGLDTTDYAEFNSSFVDLNGSALTSATINTLKTKVQIRMNTPAKDFSRICHTTPGQYNTLAIQGFGARQYQAAEGQANTSYGYPEKYVDGDTMWICDADFDEDRVAMRRASDYFIFELKPFGSVNRDGLTLRQAPGDNNVGADAWFEQISHYYNLGFDGGGEPGAGNGASAFVQRAQVVNSQSNVLS
jgi:hypothetical protein